MPLNSHSEEAYEFWPEVQLNYWFDDRTRGIAMASISRKLHLMVRMWVAEKRGALRQGVTLG